MDSEIVINFNSLKITFGIIVGIKEFLLTLKSKNMSILIAISAWCKILTIF